MAAAAAQGRGAPIKRIRDLLALAASANPHEAAIARLRAEELLARYQLTEADLVEKQTYVAELGRAQDGQQRQELGRVVAHSRGVLAEHTADGEMRFTGYAEAARDARDLFVALVRIVDRHVELPTGQPDSERFLWRTCFWLGYVAAIQRQLDPEHASVPADALKNILQRTQAPPVIERAAQAFSELRGRLQGMGAPDAHFAAEDFKRVAYESGLALGRQVPVPLYRGKR